MIVQNPGDPKPVATIPPDEDAEAIPEAVGHKYPEDRIPRRFESQSDNTK